MRIEPTHFIEVWKWYTGDIGFSETPVEIKYMYHQLRFSKRADIPTVAIFLIRPKTPQEQEKSIYYPKPTTK